MPIVWVQARIDGFRCPSTNRLSVRPWLSEWEDGNRLVQSLYDTLYELYDNRKRTHHWLAKEDQPVFVPKPALYQKKVLLCIWWSTSGIVSYKLLPSGKTITKEVYSSQLRQVAQSILKKMPAVADRKGVIFHQDNARPHTAKAALKVIKELGWELHPPDRAIRLSSVLFPR